MKKGKKYAFIGLIVLLVVLLSVLVFSAIGKTIFVSGPTYGSIRGEYEGTAGVRHRVGEIPHAVFADYLKVSGSSDSTKLFGIEQIKAATYVVPLIRGATCNDLCRYTLGGQCKGAVRSSGGDWVGMQFDSQASTRDNKLVLTGGSASVLCNRDQSYFEDGAVMCFCGS